MRIITISNQKGGVGKSTTCINLGAGLASMGKKVLIIDLDPQGNTTSGFNLKKDMELSVYEILVNNIPLKKAIIKTKWDNLDLIGSNLILANAEMELFNKKNREIILKDAIKQANLKEYDYILIDTCPSLGNLTINAFCASNEIIIPVEPSMYALEGLQYLLKVINLIKEQFNSSLKINGVLMTRVHPSANIAKDFEQELREILGAKVFKSMIHNTVKVVEAEVEKIPLIHFDKQARASKEYINFVKEILENE